jgi:diadenosine tetraphosphate (Ap4A) HIT family hydrolase
MRVIDKFVNEEIQKQFEKNCNCALATDVRISDNYRTGQIFIRVCRHEIWAENIINPDKDEKDVAKQFQEIADKYNIDIGDYIDESADGNTKGQKDCCLICNIYANRKNPAKKIVDTVIYESKNFFAVPALGTLLPGYLMICPKRHIMSMAECNNAEFEELNNQVIPDVSKILEETFGKGCCIFENGSGTAGNGKQHKGSIVHAHLHIIPTDFTISDEEAKRINMEPEDWNEIRLYVDDPYIFFRDNKGKSIISYDPDTYRPRQYVRQLIATSEGMPGSLWNWRSHACAETTEDTVDQIAHYLRQTWKGQSETIRCSTREFLKEMEIQKQ